MKTRDKKSRKLRLILVASLVALLFLPSFASSEETYVFERMWPTLQQPWYFYYPNGVATDSSGNVYIADTRHHRIQKFTSDGAFIAKWGSEEGTGDGEFDEPHGIAADGSGNVYVADTNNHRIQKFASDGAFIATWGSEGSAAGQFDYPKAIATDGSGNVYVADTNNHRIQKFTSDGTFIARWGSGGDEAAKFYYPWGIAVDGSANVYVADTFNHRIQKFTSDGAFIATWGSEGSADGQFSYPVGIVMDGSGNVYVADNDNHRIQKFTSDGAFIAGWGSEGTGDGQFDEPRGIAIDGSGNVYVADTWNYRVQKFTSDGAFIARWQSEGTGDGEFEEPGGIAIDDSGNICVADTDNHRIQKFTSDGTFIGKWGSEGTGVGQFDRPTGIAIDGSGNVYVADYGNHRIQKFTSDGTFIATWGSGGIGVGEFDYPIGIATDSSGNVYVADSWNHRIQKFTSDGTFVATWGSEGTGVGQFDRPTGIAIDGSGNVYVSEYYNHRVQKFTPGGSFMGEWGSEGSGDGQFDLPVGIATDGSGNVYVADEFNNRIQSFTSDGEFVAKFGGFGSDPGQLRKPLFLCVSTNGRIYVTDTKNHRIQVFSPGTVPSPGERTDKAIVVAGGGAFTGNNIWDATQMCANYAYRVLTYQGYTKDTIYYLTSDTDLDLDGNGILDDVDADATNGNLEYAITTWAQDAADLFIYMVNHGGEGTFRMGATELLYASDLDTWLDDIQETIPGTVTLLYDACRSGSFLSILDPPAGKGRILATSASANEEAIFGSQGTISFSFLLWGRMFNGDSFYDSFYHATNSLGVTYPQTPLLEGNGNGIGNETADKEAAQALRIGNETRSAGDIPVIGSVSPGQTLDGETSCLIYAQDVVDADGISRVWAVITPPGYSSSSPDNPVTDLPIVDLTSVGDNRYEGTYSNVTMTGTYNIAVYAADGGGVLSLPKSTTVTVTGTGGAENGYLVTSDLWIRAVINTEEKGPIEAVWQKGGEGTTSAGDLVIWGHFYASPADVTWGSANNPDLFVKLWFDHRGRLDVNFFHVSVPDIEVYSDYPYDGMVDEQGMTTQDRRYIRQYYEGGQSDSEDNYEDGVPAAGYSPAGNPWGNMTINDLRIGSIINTVEKGPIDAVWRLGGQDTTTRGDEVVWGHFYASPSDVTWGSQDNPDLFVKIWFDYTGRVDVNFFHVSVPDIEVYSDLPTDAAYDQRGTTIMVDRYIRHEYWRQINTLTHIH